MFHIVGKSVISAAALTLEGTLASNTSADISISTGGGEVEVFWNDDDNWILLITLEEFVFSEAAFTLEETLVYMVWVVVCGSLIILAGGEVEVELNGDGNCEADETPRVDVWLGV